MLIKLIYFIFSSISFLISFDGKMHIFEAIFSFEYKIKTHSKFRFHVFQDLIKINKNNCILCMNTNTRVDKYSTVKIEERNQKCAFFIYSLRGSVPAN